jgi:hypothetical protein
LLGLLENGHGKDSAAVESELQRLEYLNPTSTPVLIGEYQDADWKLVGTTGFPKPHVPGKGIYSLGGISFGCFEPQPMMFQLDRVSNTISPTGNFDDDVVSNTISPTRNFDDDVETRRFTNCTEMTCVDQGYPPFKAVMTNTALCKPRAAGRGAGKRLEMWFTGGELKPAPDTDRSTLQMWKDTFGTGVQNQTWQTKLKNQLLGLWMGLVQPGDLAADGTISYTMSRSPRGFLDYLYIDEEWRVTRGNRGTIGVGYRGADAALQAKPCVWGDAP